jgi:hypothetical protein
MVLMAALLTRVGPLQTFPILIAVVTAFLGVEAVKFLLSNHRQLRSRVSIWHGRHAERD